MKKILYILFIILFVLVLSVFYFTTSDRESRAKTKDFICSKFIPNNMCQNLYNSYNVKFLPETQLANLELQKINLDDNYDYKKYFLEIGNSKLILVELDGSIKLAELIDFKKSKVEDIEFKTTNSNLTEITQSGQILDILVYKDQLFASYFNYSNVLNCKLINIAVANIESNNFEFSDFLTINECQDGVINGGRLKGFVKKGIDGLLLTTSQNSGNFSNMKAQDDNSIYGKILFIDLNKKNYEIFAKGFRNPQGLYVDGDLIISTEHGPRGGDEINKITQYKNYGWPVASYGEPYGKGYGTRNSEFLLNNYYKKNHSLFGYEEPLYSFVPSIGISEIIKVPNNFHPKWSNNFIISSLGGRSIYRVKFDENYSRVLLSEQIYIGNRIRDLIYSEKLNLIFLALEDFGQLGLLSPEAYQN